MSAHSAKLPQTGERNMKEKHEGKSGEEPEKKE
jgi:hypothetical protein